MNGNDATVGEVVGDGSKFVNFLLLILLGTLTNSSYLIFFLSEFHLKALSELVTSGLVS